MTIHHVKANNSVTKLNAPMLTTYPVLIKTLDGAVFECFYSSTSREFRTIQGVFERTFQVTEVTGWMYKDSFGVPEKMIFHPMFTQSTEPTLDLPTDKARILFKLFDGTRLYGRFLNGLFCDSLGVTFALEHVESWVYVHEALP